MRSFATSFISRVLKITGITIAILLALLFLAPYAFPNAVGEKIKEWTNKSIKGELNFSKVRLSFFNHFPYLTFTLYDFSLKGSAPFQSDTFVSAHEVALGINLRSLVFDKAVQISKIYIDDAEINIQVNPDGRANYNVYESAAGNASAADTAGTSLRLEKIEITKCHLLYNDRSVPLLIEAKGLNYEGTGDLSKNIFDLYSSLRADSISFSILGETYLTDKKLDADLITKINTTSLSFLFTKNDLRVNRLLLQFNGKLDFLKEGYEFDMSLQSRQSDLRDFLTAFPPQYVTWLGKAEVTGLAELHAAFKGRYAAHNNQMPTLSCDLKVQDGYVSYEKAPVPASNLFVNLAMVLPSLNTDSLRINMDSMSFNVGKGYLRASLRSTGLASPILSARADADLDLGRLDKAIGIGLFTMNGKMVLKLRADGKYAKGVVASGLRGKKDTVIVSIPSYQLEANVHNGLFKLASLPEAIHDIQLELHASCPDSNYRKSMVLLDTIQAIALDNYIRGSARLGDLKEISLDANLKSDINLANIKKYYPIDSLAFAGMLRMDVYAKGKYMPKKKLFPRTMVNINLSGGSLQTKYYPHPIEQISLHASAVNNGETLKSLQASISPASFQFEGKSFSFNASFKDFEDLFYDIRANGELDFEKIYRVFSRQGVDVTGSAKMNVALKGRQSDAAQGRYNHLQNSGTLQLNDIRVTHEYFPKPFHIIEGNFQFQQDKMWFNRFKANYGQSDLRLDGYLSNAVNFFLSKNQVLSGNFNLNANLIVVDEFTSFANDSKGAKTDATHVPAGETGVVMIPSNLDLTIKATAKKISYNGLDLEHFTGGVVINKGQMKLTETGFSMVGTDVKMDGLYAHASPARANFQYHLQANDFDIQRAYKGVRLFRDMASAAAKCQGIISLDYTLQGSLNGKMYPIYPSLVGGGVVSIRNVKVKGLKLLNAVSRQTGQDGLKDPDLSKINIKSRVKNNLINIERFKFKTAGLRIRVEGQTSFDNLINFKIRVGLPPLGIIGVPVRATGSADNPKIKIGKKDYERLAEKEDDDALRY